MNSRNTFKGEITLRKSTYQDTPINGSIAYTLPNKPNQAIALMKNDNDKQITNQIMFIPFPQIRNLIVTFMKPYPSLQKDYSQILAQQYQKNKILQKLDISINQKISKAYHQKLKLQKILKCFEKAQNLQHSVNDLKKSILQNSEDNLLQKVKQIQRQPESEEKNKKIIKQFEIHESQYEKKNNDYIRLSFTFSEVKEFTKEMQKIVPIIWRFEDIPDSKEDLRSQDFISYFLLTIKQQKNKLTDFIQQSEVWLQIFRNKVKTQSWLDTQDSDDFKNYQNQLKELNHLYQTCYQNIRIKVYRKLKEIAKLDQYIVYNIDTQIAEKKREYERSVETYTNIKQICNVKNKWQDFYRIIAEQQKRLSKHMRQIFIQISINCGLVVYYRPTEQFEEFSRVLSKRMYVKLIFGRRIAPLLNAINFINEEHNLMYKRACEEPRSGPKLRKQDVQQKAKSFQRDIKQLQNFQDMETSQDKTQFSYLTHLIISLNRLMALAK